MNRKTLIVLVLAGLSLSIAALLHHLRKPIDLRTLQWPTMGTIAKITIRGAVPGGVGTVPNAQATGTDPRGVGTDPRGVGTDPRGVGTVPNENAIVELVRSTYEEIEAKLSAWNPNSELCRLAAASCTNWTESASPEMRPCYAAALELAEKSGNAFNPYMGRILRNLGVGNGKYSDFDLGAIAKGFAVDLAASRLAPLWGQSPSPPWGQSPKERGQSPSIPQERGQSPKNLEGLSLLLDLGGNLRVIGEHPWRTGIRNPFAAADSSQPEYCAIIALTNGESVATSGNYERFIEKDGKRLSHILDGRTGQPTHGIAGVTVVTPSDYGAMLADGLSTTLFVLGPEAGGKFLAAHYPRALALWIPDTPESPSILATREMSDRLIRPAYSVRTCRQRICP